MDTRTMFFAGLVSALGLATAGCSEDDPKPPAADAGLTSDASPDAEACAGNACVEGPPSGAPDAAVPDEPSSVGSCCEVQSTSGCEAPDVEACVCALDRLCCAGAWDARCVELVEAEGCGSCGGSPRSVCEPLEAGDAAPITMRSALGSGGGANDAVELSCGSFVEPDVLFAFTAPEAGSYTFSTAGSEVLDTVMAVIDGSTCEGAELGCNDDGEDDLSSRLELELAAGQEVLIAVESWGDEAGEIEVEVTVSEVAQAPVGCEASELSTELPVTASGEANDRSDLLQPSCAEFGSAGEALYLFTAVDAGRYRFDTRGSVADTLLQVIEGGECAGAELACNDDSDLGGLSAIVDVELEAGQTVLVNVDSLDGVGSYALTVDRVEATDEAPTASEGSCCSVHLDTGCDDTIVEVCVCAVDAACCASGWDARCVDAVTALDCGKC